jgi:hypothetical protein
VGEFRQLGKVKTKILPLLLLLFSTNVLAAGPQIQRNVLYFSSTQEDLNWFASEEAVLRDGDPMKLFLQIYHSVSEEMISMFAENKFENRTRFLFETIQAVREVWPERYPLAVRISATVWVPGGWTIDDSVVLAKRLRDFAVDLVDCSSGGIVPDAKIPVGPGHHRVRAG